MRAGEAETGDRAPAHGYGQVTATAGRTSKSDAHRGEPIQILRISDGLCAYSIPFCRFWCGTIAIALKYFRKEPPGLAWRLLERETGFEPATHCLGSNCAATAPLPRAHPIIPSYTGKVKRACTPTIPAPTRSSTRACGAADQVAPFGRAGPAAARSVENAAEAPSATASGTALRSAGSGVVVPADARWHQRPGAADCVRCRPPTRRQRHGGAGDRVVLIPVIRTFGCFLQL